MIQYILYRIILAKKMSQINNKTILKPPNQTIYFVKKISKIKSNFITQKDNKPINQRIN